ncbi:MAG TPA: cytochrome c maturation protein CcmE, partial [Pseudoxanthomonas sp.]|nr:cytochrome c maturation protein CcmE [Pseudoxanthomonas sp.]
MNPTRRRRLLFVLLLALASAAAVALVAMALQRNVAYLYTPAEVLRGDAGVAFGIRGESPAVLANLLRAPNVPLHRRYLLCLPPPPP